MMRKQCSDKQGAESHRIHIVYATESIAVSALKDVVSMGVLLTAFWFNAAYIGGSVILSILLAFTWVIILVKWGSRRVRIVSADKLPEDLLQRK